MNKKIDQPLITIGITCYNAQETIARALKSALAQDWDHLEIIIVDDCSTDDSRGSVQAMVETHENVNLISHEVNQGVAGARQTILTHAKGAFIAFFDDDDESLPERIKTQYQRIVTYEESARETLIACYASGHRLYPNGYLLTLNAIGSQPKTPYGAAMANYLLFYGKVSGFFYGTGTPSCALMARKKTFDSVGGFDVSFRRVEDVDFAIRLALAGGHFIGCPEDLFLQHATEGGDKAPEKNLEAEVRLAEKHKDYLLSVGRYEYARRWPRIRYYHFIGRHGQMIKELLALFVRAPIKVMTHFFYTAPRRLLHEIKMGRT